MKKAVLLVPIGIAAVGAAVLFATKKPAGDKPAGEKAAPAAKTSKAAKPKNLQTGSYSFISGFQDAATVELTVQYDGDKFTYEIKEDEFLAYTSDSHVAVIWGSDFNLQFEYAGYYNGEDFAALSKSISERYQGFGEVTYGAVKGVKYVDGDNVCVAVPAGEDPHSYVLITILKGKDYDDDFTTLPDYPPVAEILSTLAFASKK